MSMQKTLILSVLFLSACGADNSGVVSNRSTSGSGLTGATTLSFRPNSPTYMAYNQDDNNPDLLKAVARQLPENEWESVIRGVVSSTGGEATSAIVGIGFDDMIDQYGKVIGTKDAEGNVIPTAVRVGLYARQYNPSTGQLGTEIRFFTATPGESFDGAQIVKLKADAGPTIITGISVTFGWGSGRIRVIQKPLSRINMSLYTGGLPKGGLELPVGWVVTGMAVRVPSNPQPNANYKKRKTYMSDIRLDSATAK